MPRSDSTPRLSKWPFLAGDAALLGIAWLIADNSRHPLSGDVVAAIVVCGVGAAVAGAIPFLADYGGRQDEALDERQKALEALARTAATAAEQIGIAASGYQQVAEQAQAALRQADQLQQNLQKSAADTLSRLTVARADEKKKFEKELAGVRHAELDELHAVLEKITAAAADLKRAPAPETLAAPKRSEGGLATPKPGEGGPPPAPEPIAAAVDPIPPIASETPTAPAASEDGDLADGTAVAQRSTATSEAAETPKPPRKRAPRKPPAEVGRDGPSRQVEPAGRAGPPYSGAESPAGSAGSNEAELFADKPSEFSQTSPDEAMPVTSVSADGATRLLVTAYIGIGNRLFIRGEGPGLSWERGAPMQFVSIGKWRWESSEATAPVSFKLYKNDEIECSGLGRKSIGPGQQQEVTANF